MPLYTKNYLKQVFRTKTLDESLQLSSRKNTTGDSFDIFLSHCFLDKEEVQGLYIELTRMGFSVYVDWINDPQLDRTNVNKATATLLRNRMKASKTLLLAVSSNATTSKWMPWELGFMDGFTGKCAILPISGELNVEYSYRGYEYLSLYPYIKKFQDGTKRERIWIIEENLKYVVFDLWLNDVKPYERDINVAYY